MKKQLFLFILLTNISFSQSKNNNSEYLKVIKQIHTEFISAEEDTDSEDHKTAMNHALKSIKGTLSVKEIDLLIQVWLQYDPMDYPTKDLVFPILKNNIKTTLLAIEKLLKKEIDTESSTFNDLKALKKSL